MFSPPLEVVLLKVESRDAVVTHSFFKVSKVAVTKSAFPIIYNDKFTTSKSNGKWKKRDVSIYIKFVRLFGNEREATFTFTLYNKMVILTFL